MILNCRHHVYRVIVSDISLKLDALGYISVAEWLRLSSTTFTQCAPEADAGADPGVEIGGGHMASAEREPIMEVWGCAPSGVQGQSPWSGGQGVRVRSPPEAERFLVLSYVWNGAKLLCLWPVLWSLMVAAVPTRVRGSWVLIFHSWFGGHGPVAPPLDPPLSWRVPWNNGKYGLFRRSRSFKITDFGTNRKLIYDFLLVSNTNLPPILHRFKSEKIYIFRYPPCV